MPRSLIDWTLGDALLCTRRNSAWKIGAMGRDLRNYREGVEHEYLGKAVNLRLEWLDTAVDQELLDVAAFAQASPAASIDCTVRHKSRRLVCALKALAAEK